MLSWQMEVIGRGLQDLSDASIAAALNNEQVNWRPLKSLEALRWLGGGGRFQKMEDAANNPQYPPTLRGAIKATLIVIQRQDASLDLSPLSEQRLLLMACVQAGVFTREEVVALVETTRLRPIITVEEVAESRADYAVRQAKQVLYDRRVAAMDATLTAIEAGKTADEIRTAMISAWDGGA